ncbi:MAG: bifunctional phosphoglucose/phosphomannose isomerase [Candidatus Paceibacterota bacterium]
MKQAVLDFPQQFQVGLEAAQGVEVSKEFSNIIICGMGGSALPANLLITYKPELELPLYIPRNYELPPQTDEDSLVICISYSGNTEETISCYKQALAQDLTPLAITTGGELKELAEENNLPVAKIPSGIQPRQAVGYQFSALLQILNNCGIVSKPDLLHLEQDLEPQELEQQGKDLAKLLTNKLPIIYSSERFKALARIWKIKFNENAKSMAFWNYFPELNHNEMTGFELAEKQVDPEKIQVLILKNQEKEKIAERIKLTKQLLNKREINTKIIPVEGETLLTKVFNSLLLSDWTTYYLAKQYGVDPEPVPIIEDFKEQL